MNFIVVMVEIKLINFSVYTLISLPFLTQCQSLVTTFLTSHMQSIEASNMFMHRTKLNGCPVTRSTPTSYVYTLPVLPIVMVVSVCVLIVCFDSSRAIEYLVSDYVNTKNTQLKTIIFYVCIFDLVIFNIIMRLMTLKKRLCFEDGTPGKLWQLWVNQNIKI